MNISLVMFLESHPIIESSLKVVCNSFGFFTPLVYIEIETINGTLNSFFDYRFLCYVVLKDV